MHPLLTQSEQDLFHILDRVWSGTVVRQFGKRKLKADGVIDILPLSVFVPLPSDVVVLDKDDHWLAPSPSKVFFISSGTQGPHIIIEVDPTCLVG